MDGDDGLEAGSFVEERMDAFVALKSRGIEQGHAGLIA
jgi:hypothetical protein